MAVLNSQLSTLPQTDRLRKGATTGTRGHAKCSLQCPPSIRPTRTRLHLVRQALEESQVAVTQTAYLGYQEVHRPGCCVPYLQIRVAALIARFRPPCHVRQSGVLTSPLMGAAQACKGPLHQPPGRPRRRICTHRVCRPVSTVIDRPLATARTDCGDRQSLASPRLASAGKRAANPGRLAGNAGQSLELAQLWRGL